ncbi:hypothetical protein C0989_005804 [Termitomyces sp. Mn162]|nr:hypothetical protein C0989_005804 [Termitomyces sp. Mn162]
MPFGVASMPSTDRTDDEDLACSQADHSQAPSSMHLSESFLWDEAILSPMVPSNPPTSDLLELRFDGEDDFSVDVELHHHQDILEEDEDWNDRDLLSLHESNFIGFQPELEINLHATALALTQEMKCATLSSLLDLDDSDDETSYESSQEISQYENNNFDGFASGTVFRLPDGHVVCNESSSDHDSQDEVPHNLGMDDESQTYSLLPSISAPLLNWKSESIDNRHSNEYWPQKPAIDDGDDLSILPLEETNEFIYQEPEDDMELGFLSDSTCSDSNRMDTSIESAHKLFENDGDSVGVVARPVFSGTTSSHRPTFLNVTWLSQAESEQKMEPSLDGFEDSDEDSLWNVKASGDESESCVRVNEKNFMMELDHLFL